MLKYVLLRPETRGLNHESGQDHRHHDYRHSQYPALRPFFRLAERSILRFAVIFPLLACLFVAAQTSLVLAQQTTDDDDVVRVSTDLLLFPVRIRDKKGQAVAGLTEQDLLLKDEDKATTGLYFAPGADRVALLFALDQSGSLRETITQQREAALGLFSRFGERSSVAILRFSDTATLTAPFTKDLENARSAFQFRAATNRQTAIFDAASY
jgi:hypothetical protein